MSSLALFVHIAKRAHEVPHIFYSFNLEVKKGVVWVILEENHKGVSNFYKHPVERTTITSLNRKCGYGMQNPETSSIQLYI